MSVAAPGQEGIRIEAVSHRYGDVAILDGIRIESRPGQFIALIGPSGCGKTTLLDIMCGIRKHQSGNVLVGGRPPVEGRADTARMFARDALLPWRTASANIDFALKARRRPGNHDAITAQLLEDVGLTGFADNYPSQLSQGMRQRVALARTFSLESDFLFLDEPFGALDAQTKLVLQEKLLSLWERTRSTVVLVTHDLGEAIALADRVVVMTARPGRILADVPIDLPRPRSVSALQKTRAYHDLYAQLWDSLEQATASARLHPGGNA
ncbi:ABC transporter ATP-binding protein [Aestuariivirga sp. YIM B02566]|uniref:ABC transporter ATP-binding protein n=1 Tax=Taklimakanibacter albus TaxID=2800327 RepID=A0ACC5RC31_9HYPH|nr:ABC transporter ATP-binding protein [Aestuariivirga sp. YIM B02566]MBK1870202.1 ABC transporter ATP-binding protein [Aestuariivirga sp. YIM B02566]